MKQLFLKDPLFGTFLTIFLAVSAVSGVTVAHGDGLFSADVYRQGTDREVLLFRKYNEFEKNGSTATIRHVYLNTAGTASVEEEVIKENGEFKGYNVAFYELGTGGTIRREGERIYFEYTADGETEKGSYRFQPDLVCGPCIPDFIRTNWGSLEAGEPVRFHLPVMEYQRTVPFRFKRTDDSPYARPVRAQGGGRGSLEKRESRHLLHLRGMSPQEKLSALSLGMKKLHRKSALKVYSSRRKNAFFRMKRAHVASTKFLQPVFSPHLF